MNNTNDDRNGKTKRSFPYFFNGNLITMENPLIVFTIYFMHFLSVYEFSI